MIRLKVFLVGAFAKYIHKKNKRWIDNPIVTQNKTFKYLIQSAKNTVFGVDHNFSEIQTYEDFKSRVPIRDYEGLKSYIERIRSGENDVLWRKKPIYFAKTSGTTSGVKYIPITKASMPMHINAARDAIMAYIHETGNSKIVTGKMIFLQGSPVLKEEGGIQIGRLSGIAAHYVPKYLQKNRMPNWKTNCIEDWETKVEAIVSETMMEDMSVISGIPSWVQMYFEQLLKVSGEKSIAELFKNFSLFIYGGVNYAPYKSKMESLIGKKIDSIELFPASEGFFAYQDSQKKQGMLLLLNSGIFYEFVETVDLHEDNPKRISLKDVQLGKNYLMIISTDAGLWGYDIGDTIQFTSISPYRIIVSGRIEHFISAFGEHVIAKEVEQALATVSKTNNLIVNEFTVAPQVAPPRGELPYHEWFIEFEEKPKNLNEIALQIDKNLQEQNIYYKDLIEGAILQTLKIRCVAKNTFTNYMKLKGKLGGQNKIQRLSNDRKIVDDSVFCKL